MRRVASIWLPKLAIERWRKSADASLDAPIVLAIEAAHGQLIHAVTAAAATGGARPGMRLTDARALDPKLLAEPADPMGDAALLKRLARWAGRWSPLVEVDGEDGLRLDAGGVAHLFGGEAALARDMEMRFARLGLTARVAIAPTAGAAWALARYSKQTLTLPPLRGGPLPLPDAGEGDSARAERGEGLFDLLAPLPVAALRLDARSVRILERLGLKTIGQLAEVPRKSLRRRFREAAAKNGSSPNEPGFSQPLDALDRALGRRDEPLTGERDAPAPRALVRLAEPATHPEAAPQALDRLVPELARELEARRLGARRLHLAGFRVDGSTAGTGVATAIASREPGHLRRLLADKAASLDPQFGFDAFALTASWCEPLDPAQESLTQEPDEANEVAKLVDRLSVKLGAERVRVPVPQESHVPERASGWVKAISSSLPAKPVGRGTMQRRLHGPPPQPSAREELKRPHHLFDRPEAIAVVYATPEGVPRRFVWRRQVHDIARVEGPERIAPEWWRERSTARLRDYYCVEDKAGRRYWLYREGVIGDGRGGAPNWFLHGLFG